MFPSITRNKLTTLQVNLGYKCNQACAHCHVDASPLRIEMMSEKTVELIPKVIKKYNIKTLDLTGGAPELNKNFKDLVIKSRELGVEVIDRCNLTILMEPDQEGLATFLAVNKVTVIASLPCYNKENVDMQRGNGVYYKSIDALKKLNLLGYGSDNKDLKLHLIYNPLGAFLPPSQSELEIAYKKNLYDKFKIVFNDLYTITNMPIKRFASDLKRNNSYDDYITLLKTSFNKKNLDSLMCRTMLSVNWKGELFDCDFNQQLELQAGLKIKDLNELLKYDPKIEGELISIDDHCFGCTAGTGSSCGGALSKE